MGAVVAAVTVTGGYALVVFALSRLARLARRRGAGGAVLGVFDEIWHPAAVAPRIAVEQQHARRLPVTQPVIHRGWRVLVTRRTARRGPAPSAATKLIQVSMLTTTGRNPRSRVRM